MLTKNDTTRLRNLLKASGLMEHIELPRCERPSYGDTGFCFIPASLPEDADPTWCGSCSQVAQVADILGMSEKEETELLIERNPNAEPWFKPYLKNCARCGKDHRKRIEWKPLERPIGECTHWAPCPTNGQPILMHITED